MSRLDTQKQLPKELSSKMIPLPTTKRVLTWLCLCPPNKSTTTTTKRIFNYVLFTLLVFAFILSSMAAGFTFSFKFVSIDLKPSLFTFLVVAQLAATIYGLIVAFFLRHKVAAIFDGLTAIHDARE